MFEGIVFPLQLDFEHAIQRVALTSKKTAPAVMKQQAKLLFVEVAKITPPAGGAAGSTLSGKEAEKAGKLAIVRDLHMIYGMPGRAYSDIQDHDQHAADGFWSCYKQGRMDDAAKIVKTHLNKSFVPFDGGRAGRNLAHKKRKKEALFYITNPDALAAHIRELQQHVWYLASGWSPALRALGANVPYGVNMHNGPGQLHVVANDQTIEITMTNEVRYARDIKGLRDRISFAMKVRVGDLNRAWDDWMKRLARDNGFKAA